MNLWILLFLAPSVFAADGSDRCGTPLGQRPIDRASRHKRVVGGNDVSVGRWPWQVLVTSTEEQTTTHCGGTIIGDRWILTAAHCLTKNISDVTVFGGISSVNAADFIYGYAVLARKPHLEYDESIGNDIAILELEKPISFDDKVSRICLPSSNQPIPSDGLAVVTGFGKSNVRGTKKRLDDGLLRESLVPILKDDVCIERWNNMDAENTKKSKREDTESSSDFGESERETTDKSESIIDGETATDESESTSSTEETEATSTLDESEASSISEDSENPIDDHSETTITPKDSEETTVTDDDPSSTEKSEAPYPRDNFICAGTLGHGSDHGDDGGPLMMKAGDGRWFQIGVAATHCEDDYCKWYESDENPRAFTDVTKYCDWIKENTDGQVTCEDEQVVLEDVAIPE